MSLSFIRVLTVFITLTLFTTISVAEYRFISGEELVSALSQESIMLRGYFLGVIDVLKASSIESCFVVPLAADADLLMIDSFLSYWEGRVVTDDPIKAITLAMSDAYPCDLNLD